MNKKNLTNISLVCMNCLDPELAIRAMRYSSKSINFGEMILFAHKRPTNLVPEIQYIQIPKIDHLGSCFFHLKIFYKYIKKDFCLSIHDDGFVINPHLWQDDFLNYDYIGAPWPDIYQHRVGNGGFCLKSRKFMELCQPLQWAGHHDDALTCIDNRDYFIKNGCKFAPLEIAMRFSLESKIPECEYNLNNCFGFHGKGVVYDVFKGEGQQFKDRIALLSEIIDP